MKISDVTVTFLADYARLDDLTDIEMRELFAMRENAIAYIASYTGLDVDELDKYEDLTDALLILVMDAFDNRNYVLDVKNVSTNPAVVTILNMHSVNLL